MANKPGRVLITGALGGLGTAMVHHLLAEGHEIIACDRIPEAAASWWEALPSEGRQHVRFEVLDVSKEDQVTRLARELAGEGIHVAYLINNAGIQGAASIEIFDTRAWERVLRVNLHGTFYCTRSFSGAMIERGFGRIVNIASVYAYHPGPGQSPYAAAKAGITGFTRSTASDLARHGITVNAIAPGVIWHKGLEGIVPEADLERLLGQIPAGRSGKPAEIAATVAFLMSEGAAYITGQTIHVNGGLYLPG